MNQQDQDKAFHYADENWQRLKEISIIDALYDTFIAALKYKEEQQWINVEERLPEKDIPVLCLEYGSGPCVSSYTGKTKKSGAIFNDPTGYYSLEGITVTHWMPLPTHPLNR
jgi:hypothetical protein